jgi:UDP-N-acetylmuramoyl-tripeptide--D-alanyl-D-alanine ligase
VAVVISLSLADIALATGGTVVGAEAPEDVFLAGVVDTDSRLMEPGGLFFAKPGEVTDGHLFVPAAVERGAAAVVVDHLVETSVPQILVDDTVEALGRLAKFVVARVRDQGQLTIIGITGSNGKTTTKNLVAALCAQLGPTVAPRDSFNNEVGAPLTMLKLALDTRYLVLELGASGIGHIKRLTDLAAPDLGVVLMVGLAHAGEFGGVEATVTAKSELVTGLVPGAPVVLNIDDPRVASMAAMATGEVVWFGQDSAANVRASDIALSLQGTSFTLTMPSGESTSINFKVIGEHHVMNALAMASVGHLLGCSINQIKTALESVVRAERWRMELMGGNGVTVINDAYNASPDSMAAGLKTLVQVAGPNNRTIAVLGEMSELGEFSGEEHDRIALLVVRLNIDQLVVVGAGARRLHISAMNEGSWDGESQFFESADDAYDYLVSFCRADDIVLVKSSNSAQLRFLGDRVAEAFA